MFLEDPLSRKVLYSQEHFFPTLLRIVEDGSAALGSRDDLDQVFENLSQSCSILQKLASGASLAKNKGLEAAFHRLKSPVPGLVRCIGCIFARSLIGYDEQLMVVLETCVAALANLALMDEFRSGFAADVKPLLAIQQLPFPQVGIQPLLCLALCSLLHGRHILD